MSEPATSEPGGSGDLAGVDRDTFLAGLSDDERAAMTVAVREALASPEAVLSPEERAEIERAVGRQQRAEQEEAARRRRAAMSPSARRHVTVSTALRRAYDVVSLPLAILFLLNSRRMHGAYRLTWARRIGLGLKMFRNTRRIPTGTSYKAHLAMASKIFEIPPGVEGAVVECGCWKGGSTANLSLICDLVGRDLIVYDSFEGLPPAPANDKYAWEEGEGSFRGDLEVVQDHVRRHGVLDVCTFRKGFFADTLPHHTEPVAFAFLDVDYASSLHDCVLNLWPHLVDEGYLFIDEFVRLDYCALFFSERWWSTHFDRPPPGMMGVGTGIGVGQYYLGPMSARPPIQAPTSVAYTRKDFYGLWDYDPDSTDEVEKARGQ